MKTKMHHHLQHKNICVLSKLKSEQNMEGEAKKEKERIEEHKIKL